MSNQTQNVTMPSIIENIEETMQIIMSMTYILLTIFEFIIKIKGNY